MTTKILTVRIPSPLYAAICQQAAETGVPVSAYVRRMVEQEHQAQQVTELRNELLSKLDSLATPAVAAPSPMQDELLLLARGIAAHLNPQLVAQVRARLQQQQGA
ncbi:hypothetical protein [Sapientia aquatica]|uniref:hypothetical protein n=1 Tax=Sapientia aquatica TaxID=1549640 RepID=UPI0014046D6D|nr:hypothetical protein [Sapientia aquatica]